MSTKSMTGFGRAEFNTQKSKTTIEIKSLNSKQLDINTKITPVYKEREAIIRSKVASVCKRGKVEFSISYQGIGFSDYNSINKDLFKNYYAELTSLLSEVDRDSTSEHLLGAILRMPEVISSAPIKINDDEWLQLFDAIDIALEQYDNFRLKEGGVLMCDLLERIDNIEQLSNNIAQYDTQRIETIKSRIFDNLSKLKINVDMNRLEQELIYYLEKLDITEERVRLKQHLIYFREVSQSAEAGRKLGFITQEIGREINTTGSKANHPEMQKNVVEMKDQLEKIKEQLLNIL